MQEIRDDFTVMENQISFSCLQIVSGKNLAPFIALMKCCSFLINKIVYYEPKFYEWEFIRCFPLFPSTLPPE